MFFEEKSGPEGNGNVRHDLVIISRVPSFLGCPRPLGVGAGRSRGQGGECPAGARDEQGQAKGIGSQVQGVASGEVAQLH